MRRPNFYAQIFNGKVVTTDPHPYYVYRIRNLAGETLYVGMTDSPMPRMQKHQKQAVWFQGLAGSVEFYAYPDRATASRGEWQMIRELRPLENVLGNGDSANAA